jgi:Xaa-Pro aminopeptidase
MLQSFTATTAPEQGPPRLAALRGELARLGLDGFIVPRADAHQGEYVSAHDDRLAWLTGFTGSAGFCIVLPEIAGLFIDGRYRLQVRDQADMAAFTPVHWPETQPAEWLRDHARGVIGFDPWLHTPDEIEKIEAGLQGRAVTLRAVDANPLDAVWPDQPAPACGAARAHPVALAGRTSAEKRAELAQGLAAAGCVAGVITLADSLSWLLNLRGSDIPRNPVMQGFAILKADGALELFTDARKLAGLTLDADVRLQAVDAFLPALGALSGPVLVDPASAPVAVLRALKHPHRAPDPCLMPKACKTQAELDGMRAAHLRDGAAMAEFLCWFDEVAQTGLTEIDMVRKLEGLRAATGALVDLSFDTIAGSGPNGAVIHYRVTEATNRTLQTGDLFLIDSGGQYGDGTTDITRTLPVGDVPQDARAAYTRVLQGMIALSRARFPAGLSGAHLDALARYPLWLAGQDYDHGTGHGVGAALSVHEGPQRVSRIGTVPLRAGMIVSNEPGYYRPGAFGIRIENLVALVPAPLGGDGRAMLAFETLTLAPIDTRLIVPGALEAAERGWLNAYHAQVFAALSPLVGEGTRAWLERACAAI